MAAAYRRVTLVAFALIVGVLTVFGLTYGDPIQRAKALSPESFNQTLPSKLYEGDVSHPGLADANPAGTNGYCVTVQNAGIRDAATGVQGFTVENGVIIDTDFFDGGTPGNSVGDIYCVIARPNLLTRPELDGTMTIRWHFTDGIAVDSTPPLEIHVFRVDLKVLNGVVGGAAEACTVNWDPNILTGRFSNLGATLPNPVDKVRLGATPADLDWVISGGSGGPTVQKFGLFRMDQEWCLSFTSSETSGLVVTFHFDAVYNRNILADDHQHSVSAEVDFTTPDYSELRHVSPAGLLISSNVSNVNVIGSRHAVCIIPSTRDDVINLGSIQIAPGPVSNLTVFYNDQDTIFPGVPQDTLCFAWTSMQPGYQTVQAGFTYRAGHVDEEQRTAFWDTNSDGSGNPDLVDAPLVKRWGTIDRTEITRGANPESSIVTNSRITQTLVFNFADGTFATSAINLTEWVFGFTGPAADVPAFLDGVILEARIVSVCGYFLTEEGADVSRKTLSGQSIGGRLDHTGDGLPDDIIISITNDPNCGMRSVIRLEIDAYYPERGTSQPGVLFDTEWVEIALTFTAPLQTPRVAWAGQTINTTFAFAGNCDPFDGDTIVFSRSDGAPGSFITGGGVNLSGPGQATGTFRNIDRPGQPACTFTVAYESEVPGEVHIIVSFAGKEWTTTAFPILFLAIEDVTLHSTEDLPVSARGTVRAAVRGWFPGSNPSGRQATVHDDGRVTPANRWVLPDDWHLLRGDPESRPNWPSSAPMPSTTVTFYMEDEDIVNQYPDGPTEGGSGWFLLDGGEFKLNVHPRTGEPSTQGSILRPRIISDRTDASGQATVGIVGDLNLTYEGCPENIPTGNPHCGIDHIVGTTRYYAVADYPEDGNLGKNPPVRSNTSETIWRWLGYKDVSVIDTDDPAIKYVVAHLRDRDGFCDAIFQHNVLGVEVKFAIDAGDGSIIEVADRPFDLRVNHKSAIATTFDILDDHGRPMNEDIARPTLFGDNDECQAWIKISNSLLQPTNVLVTFPPQPAPIPGDVRITGLVCTGAESVTVTNVGDTPISLAGFALRSLRNSLIDPEQHLGLSGYLEPGESKTFPGGPFATDNGWLFPTQDRIFADSIDDYARLVWNEFELHRVYCDGEEFLASPPDPLPADGEGEIMIDVVIRWVDDEPMHLVEGWNLVAMNGQSGAVDEVFGIHKEELIAVYYYESTTGGWRRYINGAPSFAITLDEMEFGNVYWILVKRSFSLPLP